VPQPPAVTEESVAGDGRNNLPAMVGISPEMVGISQPTVGISIRHLCLDTERGQLGEIERTAWQTQQIWKKEVGRKVLDGRKEDRRWWRMKAETWSGRRGKDAGGKLNRSS